VDIGCTLVNSSSELAICFSHLDGIATGSTLLRKGLRGVGLIEAIPAPGAGGNRG
jgi:hypothetical protein